ncbi:MAG: TetR/AcrR family transcriptional regulator [Solirubrobacterales bacterium]|nr:TetR/AcrR family transcriptional regulator [Solirubrobacterales bacterium]
MTPSERALRADAERNRQRLLDAAQALFRERGLDVGVAEIAQRAGVGRGTLFRNFPTKQDLIAAIVIARMKEATDYGRTLLDAPDAGEALFGFLEEIVGRQQLDRCLFDAVAHTFLANQEIRAAHADIVGGLDDLLSRAKEAGAVRSDVGAMDVLMLVKGVCEAASALATTEPAVVGRQLDLVRAAISVSGTDRPLRGRAPTLADVERAHPPTPATVAEASA